MDARPQGLKRRHHTPMLKVQQIVNKIWQTGDTMSAVNAMVASLRIETTLSLELSVVAEDFIRQL